MARLQHRLTVLKLVTAVRPYCLQCSSASFCSLLLRVWAFASSPARFRSQAHARLLSQLLVIDQKTTMMLRTLGYSGAKSSRRRPTRKGTAVLQVDQLKRLRLARCMLGRYDQIPRCRGNGLLILMYLDCVDKINCNFASTVILMFLMNSFIVTQHTSSAHLVSAAQEATTAARQVRNHAFQNSSIDPSSANIGIRRLHVQFRGSLEGFDHGA